jgi:phosphoribosylformylglycinamidine synthase
VASAHDVSEGGLGVAFAESAMGARGLGATVTLTGDMTSALFSETQSRFVVSVRPEHQEAFELAVADASLVGTVTVTGNLHIESASREVAIHMTVDDLRDAWKGAIPCLLN